MPELDEITITCKSFKHYKCLRYYSKAMYVQLIYINVEHGTISVSLGVAVSTG